MINVGTIVGFQKLLEARRKQKEAIPPEDPVSPDEAFSEAGEENLRGERQLVSEVLSGTRPDEQYAAADPVVMSTRTPIAFPGDNEA